jgi:hypothetical protein
MTRVIMISRSDSRTDRSNTPIIYRAFPVWNVRVSQLVDDLVRNNSETRWFGTVLICRYSTSPDPPILSPLLTGCRRTLVRIDSETGSPMHATGLSLETVIGGPRSRCGSPTTLKKYDSYSSETARMSLDDMYRLSQLAPLVNSKSYRE